MDPEGAVIIKVTCVAVTAFVLADTMGFSMAIRWAFNVGVESDYVVVAGFHEFATTKDVKIFAIGVQGVFAAAFELVVL